MGIIETIIISILTLLLGFFFGKWRDRSDHIFNKKLEIYSDVIYKISSYSFLIDSIKNKFEIYVDTSSGIKEDHNDVNKKSNINSRPEEDIEIVMNKFKGLSPIDSIIKILAPARLIGTHKINNEIREYYSLINELDNVDSELMKNKLNEISKSAMRLEQLMRADLFGSWNRYLSNFDIEKHCENSPLEKAQNEDQK